MYNQRICLIFATPQPIQEIIMSSHQLKVPQIMWISYKKGVTQAIMRSKPCSSTGLSVRPAEVTLSTIPM